MESEQVKNPGLNLVGKLPEVEHKDIAMIAIPVLAISAAELCYLTGNVKYSVWLHVLTLIGLSLSTIKQSDSNVSMIIQALMLLPLLRLVNVSMPVFFEITLYSFIFVYAPLMIPAYFVAVQQKFTLEQLGVTSKNIIRYLPLALLVGIFIGQGEYWTIKANYLIPDLSLISVLKLSIVMIFFVGLVEELIFRSILQTRLEETLGLFPGLIIASFLFGMMHSVYGTPYEILYTALAGFAFGVLFQKTRNLPVTAIAHGCVNIFLFGFIPHLGPGLGFI